MLHRRSGHSHGRRKGLGLPGKMLQFLQKKIRHPDFVRSLYHDIDGGSGENPVILRLRLAGVTWTSSPG